MVVHMFMSESSDKGDCKKSHNVIADAPFDFAIFAVSIIGFVRPEDDITKRISPFFITEAFIFDIIISVSNEQFTFSLNIFV